MVVYDHHVHSTYSDGSFLSWMVEAAADAGVDGVGIADHCVVTPTEAARTYRREMGFNLDVVHERRRAAIRELDESHEIDVFDAVEVDYHPDHEAAIASFLETAGFDYTVGSVHHLDGVNVHDRDHFADYDESTREQLVDRYFDKLVALVESGLFAVAAHPDLIERNPALRGLAGPEQYERVAAAFCDSRTVPELNAGRADREYGRLHPAPAFVDALADAGAAFALGTDSHDPERIEPRATALSEAVTDRGLEPVTVAERAVDRQ